jgi:predicted ATPase
MSAGHGGQVLISSATQELLLDELPEEVSLRDLGERRLKDLIRPEHIYQLVSANLSVDFPALKTLDAYRHNLPTQLTSFIGREKEMEQIAQAISDHRLVTLTGSGGAGKTRLSLQVAADLLDQFPDGVWFVELAPLTDPGFIPQTILSALGIPEQPGLTVLQLLMDYLHEKKILLVLDNCEHLIEACAKLADTLLSNAHTLRIVATSREALGVGGELIWHVPSLSLPDAKQLITVEQLSQYEAVQLFVERATLVQPHFLVTNDNAPAVAQICFRLDGIPLAIELAAARVRALSVEQISKRLDDRFRLLMGGSRTALERHQTLRAAIDWSYNLLPLAEQVLFQRLSVFVDGWTLEAAESVCGDSSTSLPEEQVAPLRAGSGLVQSDDVLDLLEQLIHKSMVIKEEEHSVSRYHMLETIRQYANEKLVESGESDALRNRHLEFFSWIAREAEPKLYGAEQVACLNWLEVELDNFRAALDWSLEEGDAELGIRLAGALWRFWVMRGYWSEGYERLKRALSRKDSVSAAARAKALGRAGELALRKGDFAVAHTLLTESLTLCRELGDEEGAAFSLYGFARLVRFQDDLARGHSLLEQSLMIYRKLNDKWGIALVLDSLGFVAKEKSDLVSARTLREDSLAIFRELSDYWDMMRLLHNLGELARFEGDYARAKALYEEARALGQELGVAKWDLANQLIGLGYAVLRDGNDGRAVTHFKESVVLQREQGLTTLLMALCIAGLGGVAAARGQSVPATQLLGAAKSLMTVCEAKGEYMELLDRVEFDRDVAVVHAQLDEATFNAAWEEGQKMTKDEALDLALKMVEEIK